MDNIRIITVRPAWETFPINDFAAVYFLFTIGLVVAADIIMKVPTNFALSCKFICSYSTNNQKTKYNDDSVNNMTL